MTDLDKLIEAVEGGFSPLDAIAKMKIFGLPSLLNNNLHEASHAFHGSLDAAKALHDALLGEAHWSIAEDDDYGFCGKVYMREWFHEHSHVAARAWLLAILKAYRSLQ